MPLRGNHPMHTEMPLRMLDPFLPAILLKDGSTMIQLYWMYSTWSSLHCPYAGHIHICMWGNLSVPARSTESALILWPELANNCYCHHPHKHEADFRNQKHLTLSIEHRERLFPCSGDMCLLVHNLLHAVKFCATVAVQQQLIATSLAPVQHPIQPLNRPGDRQASYAGRV